MNWLAVAAIGSGAVSGALAYNNAADEQRRKNALVDARITGIKEQRKHDRKMFELQTFSAYRGAETAGTLRIARQMSMGAKGGTYGSGQMDFFRVKRDRWLGKEVEMFRDKQAETHIGELKGQKVSPGRAGTAAGLEALISTAIPFIPAG